ncbi:CLP protease proteolytic subunit 6 isoform 1 [Hibiscus syriacus]|uniref:ditrans,polycis-polyprenyl diphosphate synthase [(2E,6E)-farnesyldiphosphate specific] n=1 Tax=Hibiscus syriacus TaxID=106335 RepID=A0A6A3AZK3_HIBSY|nr:dehydrodolichyl diphosphate synthase complex subunit NUS1-like isoform X1 [Hibiscus syriacus]XP_038996116.1 dehydrodolichyl diphosphate synthase complex subunit NUS1-like isoform X2 [Hibiscus syriacus]KAE8708402.1 CLP protease proteolytic subunit 6 isoform 1 [Hibiscus syriacus]
MDFSRKKRMLRFWTDKIGNILLRMSWHLLHAIIYLCYFTTGMVHALESHLISRGLLRRYKSLHISKINYLAIVIESEDACRTSNVIQLLQWVVALGINHICLYDNEGILKKSKDLILDKFDGAILFQDTHEDNILLDQPCMTLEFVSFSDGKEAVARAANVLLMKYIKSGATGSNQGEQIFTDSQMSEALKTVGSGGPEPDLILIYGPARCHLGFPAWRMRYTEIQHMGPLKSMEYGSLIKAIYRFTTVRQNYGK